jgi:hypothetical protein
MDNFYYIIGAFITNHKEFNNFNWWYSTVDSGYTGDDARVLFHLKQQTTRFSSKYGRYNSGITFVVCFTVNTARAESQCPLSPARPLILDK